MAAVRTTCPYCGVGCGIRARVTGDRQIVVRGDPDHPANAGKLCSKGTHLGETVGLEGRLLSPMIGDQTRGWDEALALVAQRFSETIAQHGPDSVAFYVSGQLLTEDYYVANKLMKGFIGSANIDTNSRLCMASAVAAHNRAFGEDIVACSYSDLDEADLILLVGSNTAWCHPVIWQRIEAARATRGTKLVVIDPRRTETAENVDLHIAIRPDGDIALFNGLLAAMRDKGMIDAAYLAAHVSVPEGYIENLSVDCEAMGIAAAEFARLVDFVGTHPNMVTLFSQGVNQSACGTDKGNAIINLHLATGRIGNPGAGPFSITGQPNAMGGREVGGLASTLAAHRGFDADECEAVQSFWNSPTIAREPGLKAVDMFRAVHDGRIKALWIMATNPAMSMPDAGFVRAALARCPFVAVSEVMETTDSSRYAHVRLPALAWGEKDGTVTNSERVISRQRAFLSPPGQARADWDIMADVARRMGHTQAFAYETPAQIFREFASQTAWNNDGRYRLDLGHMSSLSDEDYSALCPTQWGGINPFAQGHYSTADRRARMIALQAPAPEQDARFPLRLNTSRYRDQWHSMSRTGLSPTLSQHRREPLLEIHPRDAEAVGVREGSIARATGAAGSSLYRVAISAAQRPGEVNVPMHWTDQISSGGRTGRLLGQKVDPHSGQPAFKNGAVIVTPAEMRWHGFLVSVEAPEMPGDMYWTRSRIKGGWLLEMASTTAIEPSMLLPAGDRTEISDPARGTCRIAVLRDGRVQAMLFLARDAALPSREWVASRLSENRGENGAQLLAGRAPTGQPDKGPTVCLCFDIGMNTLVNAIAERQLLSVSAVGAALGAGTNCGSCRPTLARIIAEAKAHRPAAVNRAAQTPQLCDQP